MLAAVADKPEDKDAPDRAKEPEYEDPAEWVTASASFHLDRKAEPEISDSSILSKIPRQLHPTLAADGFIGL